MAQEQVTIDFHLVNSDSNQKFNKAWRSLLVCTIKDAMSQVTGSIALSNSMNEMNSHFDVLAKDVNTALDKAENCASNGYSKHQGNHYDS